MSELSVIGKRLPKINSWDHLTGKALYADVIFLPRMLYCKILRSHLPHALIKNIDLSKALAVPGVFAVITGKDLPIPYGILPVSQDEHALCIDKVRFIGCIEQPITAAASSPFDSKASKFNQQRQATLQCAARQFGF